MKTTMTPLLSGGGNENRYQLGGKENDGAELTAPSAEGHPVDENEPSSVESSSRNSDEVTSKKGDIFDDLSAFERPIDQIVSSERLLTSLPVRKPKRSEWVRTHSAIQARVQIYEDSEEHSWYIVMPKVVDSLSDVVRHVQLSLAVNYAGNAFIWPVPIPGERKPHRAHITAFQGAEQARREWIRISWGDGVCDDN